MIVFDRPLKIRLHESGWVDHLRFDASLVLDGLTWLRVQGGFGSRGDREDWILAVPAYCLSVSKWRDEDWDSGGHRFPTREEAMRHALARGRSSVRYFIRESESKLAAQRDALALMESAA